MTPLARGTQTSKRGHFQRVDDRVGDVLGLDRFDPPLADAAGQLRVDDGRHHAGDLDAAAAQLLADRLAEADDRVLGAE